MGTFVDPATGDVLQREWTNAFYNFDNASLSACHAGTVLICAQLSRPLSESGSQVSRPAANDCCAGGHGFPDVVCDFHPRWLHPHHVCHDGLTVSCHRVCTIGAAVPVLAFCAVGSKHASIFSRLCLSHYCPPPALPWPPCEQQVHAGRAAQGWQQPGGLPVLVCLHHALLLLRAQPV